MDRARCPTCTKIVTVAGESSPIKGRLLRHRRGVVDQMAGDGMCPSGGQHRARIADLIHPCVDCAALPPLVSDDEYDQAPGVTTARPPRPRPTSGRPPRCTTHRKELRAAQRERAADTQRTRRFGITRAQFEALVAVQGAACACGVDHASSRRRPSVDHDHARQAQCIAAGRHGPETCCTWCVRGILGDQCNRVVIARYTPAQLRALADYQERPTAQRLGWWDFPLTEHDPDLFERTDMPTETDAERMTRLDNVNRPWTAQEAAEAAELRAAGADRDR